MDFLQRFIAKFAVKKAAMKMLDMLKSRLQGKKTYVTVIAGLIVAGVGVLFGPVDLPGPVDIPEVSANDFIKLLWEGLLVGFLRIGIKSGASQ